MSKKNAAVSSMGMEQNWQAQSDMRTLIEAQVIRNDPKRLKAAQAEAKKQAEALEEAFESGADDKSAEK